jgi:hypothetical protein
MAKAIECGGWHLEMWGHKTKIDHLERNPNLPVGHNCLQQILVKLVRNFTLSAFKRKECHKEATYAKGCEDQLQLQNLSS